MMSPKWQHQAMDFQVSVLVSLKGQHQVIMRIIFIENLEVICAVVCTPADYSVEIKESQEYNGTNSEHHLDVSLSGKTGWMGYDDEF